MPAKSRSRTTTKRTTTKETETSASSLPGSTRLVSRRLPKERPPTRPGEMLLEEFLKPLGVSQSAFARKLGISAPRLSEIIRGRRSMTPDIALRLARVLGMPADFWLGLQMDWDLWQAMQDAQGPEIEKLTPLSSSSS